VYRDCEAVYMLHPNINKSVVSGKNIGLKLPAGIDFFKNTAPGISFP
jgi:hypothetical protein